MSAPFRPTDEFMELLQGTVDGELTPSEHHRLEELLGAAPEARLFFAEFLQLHAMLSHHAVQLSMDDPCGDSAFAPAPLPDGPGSDSVEPNIACGNSSRRLFFIAVPVGLAAVLLIGVGLPRLLPRGAWFQTGHVERIGRMAAGAAGPRMSRPSAPVAILTSQGSARWSDPTLQVGQPLFEGQTVTLERGTAQISIGYGAEILARGPCSLTLLAGDRVRLGEGEIVVDVAPWARGFTVITDNMDIVDLGTKFAVSASSEATAETTVLQGLVRARPTKTHEGQQRSVLLSEGERLFVDELGNRRSERHVPAEVLGDLDASLPAPYRPVTLHNTGIGIAEGDPDPNWRVISGPEGAFQEPEFAQVCVPHERYLANDPAESQWVSMKDWATAAPNSIYTFRTTFRLTGYDLSTMRLFGRFLADNGVAEVRVNGRAVAVESWTDQLLGQRFDDPQFRFVNVTDGLVDGENVIEIDVWNGTVNHGPETRVVVPNHMALRTEWYAFGRPASEEDEDETKTTRRRRHEVIGR